MWRAVCALLVVGGCWSDDPPVDGDLTAAQLAALRTAFAKPGDRGCDLPSGGFEATKCMLAERLGQQLFFDPSLSPSKVYSCKTCHDPDAFLIDGRTPNDLSATAAGVTKHNTPTVLDVATKYDARFTDAAFTWTGKYATPGAVLDLAVRKALLTTDQDFANAVLANPGYVMEYEQLFGSPDNSTTEFQNLERVFDAYLFELNTSSPFDRYIAGDDNALSESARRGFGVFCGRGTCITCHRGPALTDDVAHVTGLAHDPTLPTDEGRMDVTGDAADEGAFMTASLRNVANTGPYMHDGSIETLDEVIAFYRRGGDPSGYLGTKDEKIQPLAITDDDARDLEAFLDALTADQLPAPALLRDIHLPPCPSGQASCSNGCFDLQTSFDNCGACGQSCMPTTTCSGGSCIPACPLGTAACNGTCIDVQSDPNNCGFCGNHCAVACMGGVCTSG